MHESVNIATALAAARQYLREADRALYICYGEDGPYQPPEVEWSIGDNVERAFLQVLTLLELLGLSLSYNKMKAEWDKARESKEGFGHYVRDDYDEPHLLWSLVVEKHIACLEAAFGLAGTPHIQKNLESILRATQYSICDRKCFDALPSSEADVHMRVEAVLRCVFPDLKHKPKLTKQIKNFEPDTGLPSLRTLIDYKFITNDNDAKRIADEILADTRGFVSRDYNRFIFLIYETRRCRKESEWNQLLRDCGTAQNASAIVICGEPSEDKAKPKRKRSR